MIVIVAGEAPWSKIKSTLDYFHRRDRYTLVLTDVPLARRWAMETGVKFQELAPGKAIDRIDYKRVHAIGAAGAIADLARARGRRVVETP